MRKIVRMRFKRSELLYDIANVAFVEGDVMPELMQHNKHLTQDITQKGNVDRVTRIMNVVVEECRMLLLPFTKTIIENDIKVDNVLNIKEEYEIDLSVPENFPKGSVDYIAKLIHEFIVARVLHDWFLITNIEKANTWGMRATKYLDDIKNTANKRLTVLTRPLRPF